MLNVSPAGAAGVIAYEAIVPPEEAIVYPVIALLTVLVSEGLESVKAGAARGAVVEVGVGGTYAGVVTGSEAADIGDVPSPVVAETVKVYVVSA
ncbi:unannotated protein [freshwater metagenome]|uniref:Unannotated protein n=1 Tax=freshwater metagenome TaxID=449393 RepID=A0A6J7A8Z9_9ZZZZ